MTKALATVGNWSVEDIQTMKDTLAKGTTDSQFQLFLRTAHVSGLNPFLNHIYAITYQGTMSLQIGIEGISHLAKQHPEYMGYDAQVVCSNDKFKAKRVNVINEAGESVDSWEIIEHEVGFPRGDIIGCYAVAYRKGFRPFTVLIDWSEVEHFQRSSIANQQKMWKTYTADMFKKHCGKRALKGQFGIDINEDDVALQEPSINNVDPYQRKEVGEQPPQNFANNTQPQQMPEGAAQQVKKEPTEADKKKTEERAMRAANDAIKANAFKLGIDDDAIGGYMKQHFPQLQEGEKLTLAQKQKLIKIMDAEIEMKSEMADSLE